MPSTKSLIPTTVNADLQKERNGANLNVEEFATWYYGGADKLKFKRDVEKYLYDGTKNDGTLFHYKSHDEIYNYAVETSFDMLKRLKKCQAELNPGGSDIFLDLIEHPLTFGATPAGNPFGVAMGMAVSAMRNEGTDEQIEKFGKRMERLEISAAYAQTEMGHGTFVRGLETRADFVRETDEFVINTPTLTAYKWWPGGLGHSSNYCILVARLYIDDEPKGVHMFFVPLRDEETHMPLPGVECGDIGTKLGFYGVNNGYLGLKNVRIPRTNMLMRNSKVQRDGTYIQSPVSVLTYFTMVNIRCLIVRNSAHFLAIGATIATRYSAVRRQSPINPNEPEPQILDHVTQQLKIFPEIANAIAYHLSSNYVFDVYHQTKAEIARGEFNRLPEMHALTCALKALGSADSAAGIERMRLGCGGHGYLTSSKMGPLFAAAQAACTYEGENTVLLLQTGRYLLKCWRSIITGKAMLAPTVAYMGECWQKPEFGQWTGTWQNMVEALQFVAANKTRLAFESMSERLKAGQTEAEAANNTGIEIMQAAELHGRSFIASTFLTQVTCTATSQRSTVLNKVLEQLLELYLVNTILQSMKYILLFIRLDDNALRALQKRLETALSNIRPNAVAICDGFDFHDNSLSSTLGSYDGNVYERIFEAAKQSPLNQQPVPKSFNEILKPFMKSNM